MMAKSPELARKDRMHHHDASPGRRGTRVGAVEHPVDVSEADKIRPYLTRHQSALGPRWAVNGFLLPEAFHLDLLLQRPLGAIRDALKTAVTNQRANGVLLSPIEDTQEVWAAGVTYRRSREARISESSTAYLYDRVYAAERVEVFFKAIGWRVMGHGDAVRVRRDASWSVPEPELTLVVNRSGSIVGYCAGNDMSSRDIEGENPLYLPQAKIYDGSCALGPGILIAGPSDLRSLSITMDISRGGQQVYQGEASTSQLKRTLEEMVSWLTREMAFPEGVFLMTGTCLVPPDDFSVEEGDEICITVGELELKNFVGR